MEVLHASRAASPSRTRPSDCSCTDARSLILSGGAVPVTDFLNARSSGPSRSRSGTSSRPATRFGPNGSNGQRQPSETWCTPT
eukprot:4830949-Amphidinium_carterae.1